MNRPTHRFPFSVLRVLRGLSLLCLAGGACGARAQTATSINEGLRLEHHATTGVSTAYWWGRAGNTYFLQHSEDLQSWIYFPELKPGADAILGENFTTTASKSFIRLRISDLPTSDPFNADFDYDGVSNSEELAQGTDPLTWNDTDTDGLSDDWEIKHFGNFNHEPEADDDQDGMSNSAEQAAGTDPNDDDSDNDGTKDGNDAYPKDDRRQENIPVSTYALIDLGKDILPPGAYVDQIALGTDGRVAFSWWEGSTYKVAKWKDGALVEPAKETALTLSDPDHYFDITFDPAYHTQTHLNSNGTVSRSDRGYVGLWPYGTTEAKQRANLDSDTNDGDYWGGQLLDNDVLVWMGWEYSFGIWKTALGSPAVEKIFGPLPGNHRYVSFDSNSTQGLIGVTRYSLHSEEVSVLDLSGNQTVIASSAGDQYPGPNLGQITVINDSRDFILSGSDQGPSLYYKAGVKVGALKSLLPTLYHAQTRYGSDPATSEAFMIGLSNSGQLLLSMENLEGPDRGAWVPRTFISDKLIDPANPNTNQRTLKVAKFPENYQVELKGGPQGMTEDGDILAATITKTKAADGTPIPEADRKGRPGLLLPVDIAVDADRNGLIEFGKDATSTQKPFRYWINDDRDHGENDDDLSGDANHSDSIINGIRDLEDVTQVKFKIPQVLIDMAKAGTAQLGFKWKDVTQGSPSVRLWSGSPNIDKPDYLKDRDTAFQTLDQNIVVGTARLVSGTSNVWLRNNLMNEATSDTVTLLMEGVTVGVGKLTFMIKVGTQESEGPSIDLKLLNVRQMYERGKITLDAPAIPHPWDNPNPPALTWVWDPWNWQPDIDQNADKRTIAYVHGWRMPYNEYIQWADTTFKRLWQLGFKGRFYTFRWPTFSGENDGIPDIADPALYAGAPGGLTYNPSEYRAWLSGPALANFVNGLPNGNARYLIAHSMGNVVAGSALRSNLQVTRYAMCNSAMAAMAYESNIIDYPGYATPDTDADVGTRQTFGLADKLNPASTEIVSFGLGPDRALASWDANNQFFKPQDSGFNVGRAYVYLPAAAIGHRLAFGDITSGSFHEIRAVTSIPEAMGYVTKSRSRAAGGKPNTRGSISSFVNMGDGGFEFGNEHSAQWVYSIQKTYSFWRRAAEEFNIDLTNR